MIWQLVIVLWLGSGFIGAGILFIRLQQNPSTRFVKREYVKDLLWVFCLGLFGGFVLLISILRTPKWNKYDWRGHS